MKIDTPEKLLEHLLQDLYSAEKQLIEALPKVAKAASNAKLKEGFETHLEQTRTHVARLEEVAKVLEMNLGNIKCKGMEGLIAEGEEAIKHMDEGELLDGTLVGGARTIEHYEILKYGMLIMMLEQDDPDTADVLKQTLDEEEETDKKLASLITT